ncbi:hypothetical protein Tco_1570250 [Tanacetum coccineum]
MESLNSNSQERERVVSIVTNATQSKGKLHEIFSTTSITSPGIMLLNLDQLEKQLDKDEFQGDRSMASFCDRCSRERSKGCSSKALDASLVVTECSGTKSDKHDTSSSSRTYITHAVDVDIRPVNDQVPFAEVQLTAQHNVLANVQQHTNQSEPSYDTYLLEKVDSNTTPDSTNMCHRGGEIDQDAEQYQAKSPLLKAEFLKTNDMVEKEVYNELSNRFLQLEKHCISLEISMQQKEESFQSNKPCKNQDAPEFCEFFEINDLKAQLQAKTTLICNLKNQIKSVKEASNEAKVKHEIDVLETINIELESSVAKLLAENEKLNKENEHLKQTYKELYDSIKKTRIQTKDHNDSLIAQVNSKTVENADLKAQIQEKVFANVALKNELRKLKGNSVDTKFAKPSILGKPVLQPPRNQSVVRQPNAFKSERPNFSKPRFASQVDVNNVLSKPVTPHYLPKVREYVLAKPHHVIAPGSSRNSQEESYGSNDMAHNHYLEEARKKTQERNRNSKPSVMHTTSLQNTTNGSKPNPRSNNQISRSLPVSKSSCGMSNGVSLVDHSRNSSSFSDSKHFVCSSCHKCVFDANHDNCITKFLKEVNSHAKIQSPKTRNNNKPVEPKSHTQKPGRQIAIGQRFSPTKSSAVHEKPNTPRSCLRWKPTGRIFKIAGLRWIPTGKMFTDNTTKVDSQLLNGSNDNITNPYECNQTLNVSAVEASLFNEKMTFEQNGSSLALQQNDVCSHQFRPRSSTTYDVCSHQFRPRSSMTNDVCLHQFRPRSLMTNDASLFNDKMTSVHISAGLALQRQNDVCSHQFRPRSSMINDVCSHQFRPRLVPQPPSPTPNLPPTKNDWGVQEPVVSTGTPSSTRIDQDTPSTSTSQTTQEEQSHVIPTSVEEDDHAIEVAHMDNDLPVSTRLQLQTEALFCYYDALLSSTEHKSYKDALTESCWIDAMKSSMSLNILEIWKLVPRPDQQKENGVVELYFVGTEFQLADIFSKPLGQEKLEFLMKNVGMQSMSPETLKKLADETEELWWLSEGYGITPEVPDETKDNSVVVEKQVGYVQTNLTLSSAELEIQSMVVVPIHQEDLIVQRTPLIDPVISMVTEKTTSTPTPPTTQAHVQMCSTSCWKDISKGV